MEPQTSTSNKLNILIIGATGNLGTLVTKHCLTKPNLQVNILVRDPHKDQELTSLVEQAGGKVFKGDITVPEALKGITKGMHTVIFLLPPFGEKVTVHGQIALIDDCVANGVQRVVPSEFAENFSKFPKEELAHLPQIMAKQKVQEHLRNLSIKVLNINTGIILDSFLKIVLGKDFAYWGNPEHKFQLTSYEDTAEFVACAIARENEEGDRVFVAHEMTVDELGKIYNKVRGTSITPKWMGTLENLVAKCEDLEKHGSKEAIMMRLFSFIFNEKTRYDKMDNKNYPEVKITPIEEFLKQRDDTAKMQFET